MKEWTILLRSKDGIRVEVIEADSIRTAPEKDLFCFDGQGSVIGSFAKEDVIGYFRGRSANMNINLEIEPKD